MLFTDAAERAKAFAVYGAIAGGGSAVGLLLGGVLTEYADWRWCFWVNVPIAVLAVVAAWLIVPESKAPGETTYDVPGAVLITVGLASLVYGFTKVAEAAQSGDGGSPWSNGPALTFIGIGAVLVVAFVVVEFRVRNPLLPMRLVLDRNRGGAYLTATLVGAGLIGSFFFLSLYFQQVLGYTPVSAGFASLPVTAGVLVAAGTASHVVLPGPFHRVLAGRPPGPGAAGPGPGLHLRAAVQPGPGRGRRARRRCGQRCAAGRAAGRRLDRHGTARDLLGHGDHRRTDRAAPDAGGPHGRAGGPGRGLHDRVHLGAGFFLVAALASAVLIQASKDDLPAEAAVHAG